MNKILYFVSLRVFDDKVAYIASIKGVSLLKLYAAFLLT
jgi:hypothetical protein